MGDTIMRSTPTFKSVLPLLALVIIMLLYGCGVDEGDIRSWSNEGKISKLVEFIEENVENPDQADLVVLAVNLLFREDIIGYGWDEISTSFFTQFEPKLQRRAILAVGGLQHLSFLQRTVPLLLYQGTKNKYQDALKLMDIAVRAKIRPIDDLKVIRDAVQQIVDLSDTSDSLRIQEKQMEKEYARLEEKIDELKRWQTQNNPIRMTGYIRAQQAEGLYEITVGQQSALLVSTDTRFETTGAFQLYVTELVEMPVTLREEYGGFTQNWKVYREVPNAEIETRFSMANEKQKQLDADTWEISSVIARANSLKRQLERLPQQINNLKKQVDDIVLLDIVY